MPNAKNGQSERRRELTRLGLLLTAAAVPWIVLLPRSDADPPTPVRVAKPVSEQPAAPVQKLPARAEEILPTERETEPSQDGSPISGLVLDAAGGPIAGARIYAIEPSSNAWSVTVESRADGRFELRVPEGTAVLRTSADGYTVDLRAVTSPDRSLRISLAAAGRITGRVVSALDNRPLFGIEVRATSATNLISTPSDAGSVSDAQGRFAIEALAADSYRIVAVSPKWFGETTKGVSVRVGDTVSDVRLALSPAVVVRGRVVLDPSGAPCSGGFAILRPETATAHAHTAAIGSDGSVEFTGIPPRTYRIQLRCQDGLARSDLPTIRVGASDLDLVWKVQGGSRALGRVVDRLGRGLARTVEARAALDEDLGRLPSRVAHSDESGTFELTGLGAGRYRVALRDAPDVARELEISPSAEPPKLTLQVEHGASLRVQLSGADSSELDAFSVHAVRRDATAPDRIDHALAAQRVGSGLFTLDDLAAGAYELYAGDGLNPETSRSVSLLADQALSLVWEIPVRDGKLEGRVMDAHGEPVSDAWVRVTTGAPPSGADRDHAVLTALDGRFALEHLDRSASYDIEASRSPESSALMRSVRPGQLAVLTLPPESD